MLVDASTSYYESYLIPVSFFGSREGSGLWATYLKTQTAPLPSAFAHIARIFAASASTSAGPIAPIAAPTGSVKAQTSALQNADTQRQLESNFTNGTPQPSPNAAVFAHLATLIQVTH